MDQIPADHVQNVDILADQVVVECLSNPIVVSKIMDHIPDAHLLQLSLVNKLWNYEARKLIRKRGNLLAHVAEAFWSDDQRSVLQKFGRDLGQMNIVMFSGISIDLWVNYRQRGRCLNPVLHPAHEAILEKLTFRNFSLKLPKQRLHDEDSPELLLMKRIFNQFSETLETLSLDIEDEEEAFLEKIVQNNSFPSLKILKLHAGSDSLDDSYNKFQDKLVSRAPNLQELHSPKGINPLGQWFSGTSAVLFYNSPVWAPFDEITDSVINRLRLEEMKLLYTGPEFDFDRFHRVAPNLLQACCTTSLRQLAVDAVPAVSLMSYGVCLKNVNQLCMYIDYRQLELVEPRILRIIKNFDFTRIFPNLHDVEIAGSHLGLGVSPDHVNTVIEEANSILREPSPHRSSNIKHLTLKALSNATVQYYAEMFPNICFLEVANDNADIPIRCIWKHWQNLKHIELEGSVTENLDSVFCGIFPEEVAELVLKDDDYLQSVNIVPVMPAITCLKKLRTFGMKFCHSQDPTLLFSKVTALVAFSRCRKLVLDLESSSAGVNEALQGMTSYATVVPYVDSNCSVNSDDDYDDAELRFLLVQDAALDDYEYYEYDEYGRYHHYVDHDQ